LGEARAHQPAARSSIPAVTPAAAGLIISSTVPLARDAITSLLAVAVALGSLLLLASTRLDTLWVIAGAAAAGLIGSVWT